jgi:hypothetical protein
MWCGKMSERLAFEDMMKTNLGTYFENNLCDLITGKIMIADDGIRIKIYRKDRGSRDCDVGIVY